MHTPNLDLPIPDALTLTASEHSPTILDSSGLSVVWPSLAGFYSI